MSAVKTKTYLLSAPKQSKKLQQLGEKALFAYINKERAVMVFDELAPPQKMVVKVLKGNVGEANEDWARRTILDELQAEHVMRGKPATKQQKAAAERKYIQTRKARKSAKMALSKAEEAFYLATNDLVRMYGRGPIVIEGETLDATYRGERVYYTPRKGM